MARVALAVPAGPMKQSKDNIRNQMSLYNFKYNCLCPLPIAELIVAGHSQQDSSAECHIFDSCALRSCSVSLNAPTTPNESSSCCFSTRSQWTWTEVG